MYCLNILRILPILDPRCFNRPLPRDLETIRLLGISVTDRFNLPCIYHIPSGVVSFENQTDLLRTDNLMPLTATANVIGVYYFKLTGEEPTVGADLLEVISSIAGLGANNLAIATNSMLLDQWADDLLKSFLSDALADYLVDKAFSTQRLEESVGELCPVYSASKANEIDWTYLSTQATYLIHDPELNRQLSID